MFSIVHLALQGGEVEGNSWSGPHAGTWKTLPQGAHGTAASKDNSRRRTFARHNPRSRVCGCCLLASFSKQDIPLEGEGPWGTPRAPVVMTMNSFVCSSGVLASPSFHHCSKVPLHVALTSCH